MEYPSKLVEHAITEISKLPGIGKKTALRLVLFLLKENEQTSLALSEAITRLRTEIKYCTVCYNLSDHDICGLCSSHRRDSSILCVVEDTRDVMAIENTAQYSGLYHVLGGVISPIDGVGPEDVTIEELVQRVKKSKGGVKEIILALSATMEGDTTAFYLSKKLTQYGVKMSTIARGIAVGTELEYADEVTLGRSILSRTHYGS